MRRFAFQGELGFPGNHVQHALLQRERRMQQLLHAQGFAHADQLAEQLADVFAQRVIRGQQAVVGVQTGVAGVVVARAQVRIAHDFARLTTQNQHHLGVGLEPHHPVDHYCARSLQTAGQLQVGLFVKTRTQLHHRRHFLAVTRRIHQRIHDLGVGTAAV